MSAALARRRSNQPTTRQSMIMVGTSQRQTVSQIQLYRYRGYNIIDTTPYSYIIQYRTTNTVPGPKRTTVQVPYPASPGYNSTDTWYRVRRPNSSYDSELTDVLSKSALRAKRISYSPNVPRHHIACT